MDALAIRSIHQDNGSAPEVFPIQSLPTTVTVGLILPLQSGSAARTDRESKAAAMQMDLTYRHRAAKRLRRIAGTAFAECAAAHTANAGTAATKGLHSSTSKTSAIFQSSFMVGFASPCSMRRRYETLIPASKARYSCVKRFSFRKNTTVSPISS